MNITGIDIYLPEQKKTMSSVNKKMMKRFRWSID